MNNLRAPLGYALIGGAAVLTISFFNSGFMTNRPLSSYLLPLFVGLLSGAIAGTLVMHLKHKQQERDGLFIGIIEALAITLEERDHYTHGHSQRVTSLAMRLGKRAGLDTERYEHLHLASVLHDIGKIGIPDKVLLKPGRLTREEFDVIKTHPGKAARILKLLNDPRMDEVIAAVRHHHERYDGSGYPAGLKGDEIPHLSRIITITDSYDAMTSNRPYRDDISPETALKEIEQGSGSQFDPQLASEFIGMMHESEISNELHEAMTQTVS